MILVFFLLIISSETFPQVLGIEWGNGKIWSDSLTSWRDISGGGPPSLSDSVAVIELQFSAQFPSGIARDTGTTYIDTLKFYKGTVRMSSGFPYQRVDTVWSDYALPIKIDNWTIDTMLVLGGRTRHFVILEPNINLLMIKRINTGDYWLGKGIKTDIIIETSRQR